MTRKIKKEGKRAEAESQWIEKAQARMKTEAYDRKQKIEDGRDKAQKRAEANERRKARIRKEAETRRRVKMVAPGKVGAEDQRKTEVEA